MHIYGIDFTSAPGTRKRIVCAAGLLRDDCLLVSDIKRWDCFAGFEALLDSSGPWVAGLDLPFGLPRRFVAAMEWPTDWNGMVEQVAALRRDGFLAALGDYAQRHVSGDREHQRPCDRLARAASPMKRINPPTARMFYEGATLLRASGVSVRPNRPKPDTRVVLETYPALIARRFLGGTSYKAEGRHGAERARQDARRRVLDGLAGRWPMLDGRPFAGAYGFALAISDDVEKQALDDGTGDTLDALSCLAEAAWGHVQRKDNYGIPAWCDLLEGWIVSPGMPHEPW